MKTIKRRLTAIGIKKFLNRETISYLICGALTTVIGLGVYALCVHIELGTAVANTISTVLAVIFAYLTNKAFVFQSRAWNIRALIPEFAKFCGVRVATYVAETGLLVLLVDVLHFPSVLTKAFTTALVVVGNYALSKWMVFTHK